MNSRSPVRRFVAAQERCDRERPRDDREEHRQQQSVHPDVPPEAGDVDRQPEADEDDDLGEACKGGVEALDRFLVRGVHVPERKPGDEDGEKARAVRDRGHSVDDACCGERTEGIEPLVRQVSRAA